MKTILDCRVRSTEWLNARNVLIKLTADQPMPHLYPGQFVEVRVDAPNVFLRRPISVHLFDPTTNELSLIVQVAGKGTKALSTVKAGDVLNLVLPLGNRFSLPDREGCRLLLAGGGVGVAPLLYLGVELQHAGHTPVFLLGARTGQDLLCTEAFARYGEVYCTTEDGSAGECGLVTQHSLLAQTSFDFIYTCGPTPMMRAVAQYARERNIPCEVSLENTMACGLGACLCCVTDTKEGHKCVCTDGPVFNINDLKW